MLVRVLIVVYTSLQWVLIYVRVITESWKIGSDLSTATVNQNTASQIKKELNAQERTGRLLHAGVECWISGVSCSDISVTVNKKAQTNIVS